MQEKIILRAKKLHQQRILDAQQKSQVLREKAFSIKEIKDAHNLYIESFNKALKSRKNPLEVSKEYYQKYIDALKKYGFDENFGYTYLCPKCEDTGYYEGKPCDCYWQEYINVLKEESELDKKAPFSFNDCDLSIVKNANQKADLEKLYDWMKKYVEKFPDVKVNNITLSGGIGTGKSCIISAMARASVEKGQSVKFLTAYEFNSLMLKSHTSPISERNLYLEDVLTCDLLFIDDLGTEPVTRNVTIEYLLLVLNERTINNRSTIITTNLNADGILARYGERIYSRLSDKLHSLFLSIRGTDLRKK